MRKPYAMLAAALAAVLLGGCGGTASTASTEMAVTEAAAYDTSAYDMSDYEVEETAEDAGIMGAAGIESVTSTTQKLIKTVDLSMETKEFDDLLDHISQQVEELGGYVQSSNVSGSSYYSTYRSRYAYLVLRIPVEKLDGFVTVVSGLGNVTNKNESVEDVTLQYVDVESHKQALQIEQERLMELLEQAESTEDIISIESRLSQVRYELQSYESTLRTWDNQVNYSTVNISIDEVERETKTVEKQSFLQEVRYRLSDNFYSIGQSLRSFAIWFLSSLPYLVIWAAVIILAVVVIRKIIRKKPFFRKKEQ